MSYPRRQIQGTAASAQIKAFWSTRQSSLGLGLLFHGTIELSQARGNEIEYRDLVLEISTGNWSEVAVSAD